MSKFIKRFIIIIVLYIGIISYNEINYKDNLSPTYNNMEQIYSDRMMFVDVRTLKVSDEAKKLIKEHEKLKLESYTLGDGHFLIGYGHLLPKSDSILIITRNEAEVLFAKDVYRIEQGVKDLLISWDIEVTQSMFDAMVSMAYNMGVYRFAQSDFIEHLKKEQYLLAAEGIKTTAVSKNFPGLKIRRINEYKLFIKDIS